MLKKRRADHAGDHRTQYEKNRAYIFKIQDTCALCGKPVDFDIPYPDPMSAVIDHIIPIAKGGHPSDIGNLQLAHQWCNRQKADKLIDLRDRFQNQNAKVSNDDLPLHYDWKNYKP